MDYAGFWSSLQQAMPAHAVQSLWDGLMRSGDHAVYNHFRRSDDIEDRRKEKFNSFPQAPQKPNVFWDPVFGPQNMTQLSQADFAPQPAQMPQLTKDMGGDILESGIQRYLAERAK